MAMSVEGEGVLSRWSRLKRGEKTASEIERERAGDEEAGANGDDGLVPAAAMAPPQDRSGEEAAGDDGDPERMLTEEDLPDIDSLTSGSDFTVFLQKNVPAHLHKLAMRKLWRSDPVLANLDGLNDYDTDYSLKEVWDIAAQSAEDLARGAKRLTASDMRARETGARRKAEAERRAQPSAPAAPDRIADAGSEARRDERPRLGQGEAEAQADAVPRTDASAPGGGKSDG